MFRLDGSWLPCRGQAALQRRAESVLSSSSTFVKRAGKRRAVPIDGFRAFQLRLDLAPGTEDVRLARERMDRLNQRLSRLSEKTRDIFLAYRVDGTIYREIARQHGLSTSTVERHIATAALRISAWMQG